MKFTQLHVQTFCKASHDRNPLHIDVDYARRTQFGRPVVYGMAAVLYALGNWANGASFRLNSLRAIFRKPLFENEEYDLVIAHADDHVVAKYRRGPVDYCVITFSATMLEIPSVDYGNAHPMFEPLQISNSKPTLSATKIDYQMHGEAWIELKSAFHLVRQSLPHHQLATLVWASYHVGMALPGQQALFSELQVTFATEDLHIAQVQLDLQPTEFDDRFNRYVMTGDGKGINHLRIVAFQRPVPVDFPLSAMPHFPAGERPLAGKVVFISGATRGFGAAMARMCALAGATLALNYRGDEVAAASLVAELKSNGTECAVFAADMTDPAAVAQMTTKIAHQFGQIDLIVNNAAPPIRDLQFGEQTNADLLHFVQQNLSITLETLRYLLPLLSPAGQFLHISTKYLVEPVRGFSHYLTAKAAQEGLMEALALEYREFEFIVARLPRILTDQTNLPFDFDPPRQPGEVAMEAILALQVQNPSGNFRTVDLFEKEDQ